MPDQGLFQTLRAMVFAVVCVLLGAAGHGLSSGAPPPLVGLVAGVPLVVVLAGWLAGRQRSLPVIAVAVTGGQLGLHALFDYAAAVPPPGVEHTHHLSTAGHAGHAAQSMTLAMAAGHLVAGLIAAWWLRRGEAAAWAHCAALAAVAAQALSLVCADPVVLPSAAAPLAGPRRPICWPRRIVQRHSLVRRGPPRPLLVH